jgi:hypothetical protein
MQGLFKIDLEFSFCFDVYVGCVIVVKVLSFRNGTGVYTSMKSKSKVSRYAMQVPRGRGHIASIHT